MACVIQSTAGAVGLALGLVDEDAIELAAVSDLRKSSPRPALP